jgi:ADP-ribose pyrophosphatase YjhB (NUDIX family)
VTGRPELCVGAIVRRRDTLLLVRRGREPAIGTWSVPGGRVERGETMAQAVERELAEETGLLGRCGRLVGWVERISDEHHFVIADFEVELEGEDEPRSITSRGSSWRLACTTSSPLTASWTLVPERLGVFAHIVRAAADGRRWRPRRATPASAVGMHRSSGCTCRLRLSTCADAQPARRPGRSTGATCRPRRPWVSSPERRRGDPRRPCYGCCSGVSGAAASSAASAAGAGSAAAACSSVAVVSSAGVG